MSQAPLLPMRRQRAKDRLGCQSIVRFALPASVVVAFLLFVFTASIIDRTRYRTPWGQPDIEFPDFSHYTLLHTLPHNVFPSRPDNDKRIIAVGDIHAMNQSLSALLDKVAYDPQSDVLLHLGDLVSKDKKVSSEPVLSFLSTNRILGVRGNNDQKVIEWKAWMDWIASLPGGKEWLEDVNSKWSHIDGDEPDPEFAAWLKKSHRKWEAYIPDGWKLHGKFYKTARDMSNKHYEYLRSLPLVLYAPTAHTYFVHAGLLPADPTRKLTDPKQPLSHLPAPTNPKEDIIVLRGLQEQALLNEIPQNQDPWVLMNMRSLAEGGKVTSGKKGSPWSDLWNDVMEDCSALPPTKQLIKHKSTTNCFPSMVLYGHAAVRDLDVKRWSIGVDTGCVYGRRLTAVVLNAGSLFPKTHPGSLDVSSADSLIPYGDEGTAHIISVKCHT